MAGIFRQVGLLLWKNYLIQKRKICASVFEVIIPVFFAILVLIFRLNNPTNHSGASFYRIEETWIPGGYGSSIFMYSPNTTVVNEVMETFLTDANIMGSGRIQINFTMVGFETEEQLENWYKNVTDVKDVLIGIVFEGLTANDSTLPKKVNYSLRPPSDRRINSWRNPDWKTADSVPVQELGAIMKTGGLNYVLSSSFVPVQILLDQAIIKYWKPSANFSSIEFKALKMPDASYDFDITFMINQIVLPLILCLGFILNIVITTKVLILEKELKLKESMKLMGLSNAAHWTAWYITAFIYLNAAVLLYILFLCAPLASNGPVLTNSNPFIIYIFLLSYGLSIISFSFLLSVCFKKANIGAAAAGIIFFVSYVPYFFIQSSYRSLTRSQKLAGCLLNNVGMATGVYSICLHEGTGEGVQWSNINKPATVDDNFAMSDAILMLLGDSVMYLIIVWYFDNVFPGEFGVPQPFYFPFMKSYWCGVKVSQVVPQDAVNDNPEQFEKEPTGTTAGISIMNLTKEFKMAGKKKKAVNNMNLNVYDGQITVLLGHNGAGKTTTMSMLSGFITPTSGKATVNGHDIATDMQGVRASLGLCPQHNVLFDTLTVDEHLEFFALLKGADKKSVKEDIATIAQEIGLETKRTTRSMHLSGGQKRKLSVGIALVHGSKIVILDEPTSGMDPAARRQIWDILQRNRQSRTILLTTHLMDEADVLGDRIAIMAEGKVKCCGSPHFLKKVYGAGYNLVLVKSEYCNVGNVTQLVQKHIPSATLRSEISAEISYLLPKEKSSKFAALFTEIESDKDALGINSFGVSATTMEEVFLKVGEGIDDDEDDKADDGQNGFTNRLYQPYGSSDKLTATSQTDIDMEGFDILAFNKGFKKMTGYQLQLSRYYGMFIKKAIHSWRNKFVSIVQLLLPVLAICAALGIDAANGSKGPAKAEKAEQYPLRAFNLQPFGGTISTLGITTKPTEETSNLTDNYKALFSPPNKLLEPSFNGTDDQKYTQFFVSEAQKLGCHWPNYNNKMVIGAYFYENGDNTDAIILYNAVPFHALPISTVYMMNAMARYFTGDNDVEIQTNNYPLPNTNDKRNSNTTRLLELMLGFLVAFLVLFGMAFLTGSFVLFLVKERQTGAKHLQKVSGVGTLVFWLSNFTWDFINYLIPCFLITIVFAAFGTEAYNADSNLGYVFLSLFLYGLCILPFIYAVQFLFITPATGVVVTILINIFTGLVTLLTVWMMNLTNDSGENPTGLDIFFSIISPQFNLGRSIMNIYTNYKSLETCRASGYPDICIKVPTHSCCSGCTKYCNLFSEDYLAWDVPGIGRYLLFMIIQGVLLFTLTLIIEAQLPQKIWYKLRPPVIDDATVSPQASFVSTPTPPIAEDDDVRNEKDRVASMGISNPSDSFVFKDLYKRYGNSVAVDRINVGIPERECFGLLGQNGAGKTTTFKMLTGDVMVTSGNAYLQNNNIKSNIQKVQENLGYCPQFDALIDQMTGRETLYMYGRLRGVPGSHLKGVVNSLIDILMLRKHADKQTSIYSGGNKRKLSTALALIGDPGFILLDEPSSGVDPRARRQLWNVLSRVRNSGKTLILTSHSMEECDALCTRVAIMVNGSFKCLGSPQHLKNKYGQGFTLVCRMKTNDEGETAGIEPLVEFIKGTFSSAEVFDNHQGYAHFQIPSNDISLGVVFDTMEKSKEGYFVEDYSVHQTTLEQVFLTFAGKQIPPKKDKTGCCKRVFCC